MRKIRAAVVRQKGGPFQIENMVLGEPRADEVRVHISLDSLPILDEISWQRLAEV